MVQCWHDKDYDFQDIVYLLIISVPRNKQKTETGKQEQVQRWTTGSMRIKGSTE